MKSTSFAILALLAAILGVARADPPQDDPFKDSLFPPELVMQNQQALSLSDDQKSYLKTELRQAQVRFTELQWKLQDEMERLQALLKPAKVDEQQALLQLEKVLSAERDIKHTQMSLLIRIKNHLTADQQTRLQEIRNKSAK
jgi:Spy/CpxP family protein refolding chaperone